MARLPRVTFGVIVLNGQPFTRYCLRVLYPFAYEIIVVEGACEAARAVSTADGHSTDGTLEELARFKREEDPENKLQIITRDGFWSEKDEQSTAYAERATGDYLWQVDIDEFYHTHDIRHVLGILQTDPTITAVSFKFLHFWGGFDYLVDGWAFRDTWCERGIHRLFKWGQGFRYASHRPVTVVDPRGRKMTAINCVSGDQLAAQDIFVYHYPFVFPKQVTAKSVYYDQAKWEPADQHSDWAERSFLCLESPFNVHRRYSLPSWLERFTGKHPAHIEALRMDIQSGLIRVDLRPTADIDRLLRSPLYMFGRAVIKSLAPLRCNLGPISGIATRMGLVVARLAASMQMSTD